MMSAMQPSDLLPTSLPTILSAPRPPSPTGFLTSRGSVRSTTARPCSPAWLSSVRRSTRSRPTPPRRPSRTRSRRSSARVACCTVRSRRSTTSPAPTPPRAWTASRRSSRRCSPPTATRSTSTPACSPGSPRCRPTSTPARWSSSRTPRGCCTARTRRFVRSGVGLDEASQDRLRALNAEIMSLEAEFGRLLLAATNAAGVLVTDEDELDGLPEDARDAAALAARTRGHEQGWFLELALPTQQAPLAAAARPRPARAGVPRVGRSRGVRAARHPCDAAEPGPRARRARPAPGVRAPRGVRRRRRDRADRAGRLGHPRAARTGGRRQRARRGCRAGRGARARPPRCPAGAVGLAVLRRAGQEGAPLARRRRPAPVPRAGAGAGRRGVPRGDRAVRPDVRGAPRPGRLPPGRARVRGVRRGRQRARTVPRRLLDAGVQARRRVDEQPRRPVDAAR